MTEAQEERNIFRVLSEYDRRIVYFLLFVIVTVVLVQPIGMPISVSPDTRTYHTVLTGLTRSDIVLFSLDTEFSGYMEIQSGVVATARVIIEREAKMAIAISHPEAVAIPDLLYSDLKAVMTQHNYVYGKDYVNLGYCYPNDASVSASAEDFQSAIRQDYAGNPLSGTFLAAVRNWRDISLIICHTTGIRSGSLLNHFALRGTRMIVNCIGNMIAGQKTYLNAGTIQGILPAMRGGAELEFLIGAPASGLTAMDAFTLGHYMLMIFIIVGNIGYLGYGRYATRKAAGGQS